MTSVSLTAVLTGANSVGLFASRAFVSAFAVAACLKFGPSIAIVQNSGILQQIDPTTIPSWFTHDITVTILGVLALLEIAATKSADARQLLNEVDAFLKSGVSFVSTLAATGIITAQDEDVIKQIISWQEPVRAGLGDDATNVVIAGFTAGGVYFASIARRNLLGVLMEADPDDDTMVGGLLSWLEDLWALLGTLLLILFPLVMLAITGVILALLAMLQWRARRRDAKSKSPCANCGALMYRSAMACPSCRTPSEAVHAVSWLGGSKESLAEDRAAQPAHLIQKQRCPVCATSLNAGRVRQACAACRHEVFADNAESQAYLTALDRRYPLVLMITAALSLIPIVGLIPAIVVYRLRLIAPLRRYLPMCRRVPMGCALKLLFMVLIWVQVIPGVGAIAVPIMASISYGSHRQLFTRQLQREREKTTEGASLDEEGVGT